MEVGIDMVFRNAQYLHFNMPQNDASPKVAITLPANQLLPNHLPLGNNSGFMMLKRHE